MLSNTLFVYMCVYVYVSVHVYLVVSAPPPTEVSFIKIEIFVLFTARATK